MQESSTEIIPNCKILYEIMKIAPHFPLKSTTPEREINSLKDTKELAENNSGHLPL